MNRNTLIRAFGLILCVVHFCSLLLLFSCEEHHTKCVLRCTDTSQGIRAYYIYDAHLNPYEYENGTIMPINDSLHMGHFGMAIDFDKGEYIIEEPEPRCCGFDYQDTETLVDMQVDVINTETNGRFDAISYFIMRYPYEGKTLEEFLNDDTKDWGANFSFNLIPNDSIPAAAQFEVTLTISDGEQYLLRSDTILFKK